MNIVVPSGGRLCADSLNTAMEAPDGAAPCLIDLREARFVDQAGLVAVAVAADRAIQRGSQVELLVPRSANVRNYLTRMRLPEVLHGLGVSTGEWRPVQANDLSDQLAELHSFHSEAELSDVVDGIVTIFAQFDRDFAQPLYNALLELGLNTVQHSRRPGDGDGSGFVAVQTYPNVRDVAFAVGDAGRGIKNSLSDTIAVGTDGAAIQLAARKHVSSVPERGRGRGITGVIELTGRHRGAVTVMSGDAQGVFTGGHWDPRVSRLPISFPGTLAQTRLAYEGRLRR